ncbi:hypothetical protein [Mesoterricola silvestris]|uniref:DUF2231 domain-containing protein n=1 Tax=Mesoterricola silvestris TaxID=2927979 RepID=A0AA48H9P6_9BACT|nr:hypothetical protein [Mesoterricola silvestris]BDU74343.1 hypothetical protein METEAL_35170 [Mesoterricola silvestris]
MCVSSFPLLLGKAHPALVHAPIGAVLFLPVLLARALRAGPDREGWLRAARFLATLGLLGGLGAIMSGFLFARHLGGLRPGEWLARPLRPGPSFKALLRSHQLLALAGLPVGAGCALALQGARGKVLGAALGLSLLWLGLWGAAGHWGGRMVFPDPPADGAPS